MKKVFYAIFPFCLGCASVNTEVLIDAEPETVWSVLIETETYGEWNPVMVSASASHEEGQTVTYEVHIEDEKPAEITSKVETLSENRLLRQSGGIWGILTFDHQYKLEPIEGRTKVIQREDYAGIGLLFWDHKKMQKVYESSNQELKQRVLSLKETSQ